MLKKTILFLFLASCTQFIKSTDKDYFDEVSPNDNHSHIQILFSHNMNGETHPCGCRKFPLGGLPQVNGIIASHKKLAPTIYVDTGDTFFESVITPKFLVESSKFKAKSIVDALNKLGLKMMVLGDQDFAMGEDFLLELSQKAQFKFLLSNASEKMKLPHEKIIMTEVLGKQLFFIGVVDPSLLQSEQRSLFSSVNLAIKKQLDYITKQPGKVENKYIILLSHQGLETDEEIAKAFPELDWIIGAHSQSYLRYSKDINKTRIGQVLSRNHYIGKIGLPINKKSEMKYELIESRDETKNLVSPNKFNEWLTSFKTELDIIQNKEQDQFAGASFDTDHKTKIPTYISCSDCHQAQVSFWQSTSHALAYSTLIDAKAQNNPSCVKCHSVGMNQTGGFVGTKNIISSEKKDFDINKYWEDFKKEHTIKHPLRKLSGKAKSVHAKKWLKSDVKKGIVANHANVQCLNCHNQNLDHPFGESSPLKAQDYQKKCLQCHTTDQSPEWYDKDAHNGLATSLNKTYFSKKLKSVSCPKIEKE